MATKAFDNQTMMTLTDLAHYLGVSFTTLQRLKREGKLPPPIKRNDRWIRWAKADVEKWIKAQTGGAQ